jgi:hypothetical protein
VSVGNVELRAVFVRLRRLLPDGLRTTTARLLVVGGLAAVGWLLGCAGQAYASDAASGPAGAQAVVKGGAGRLVGAGTPPMFEWSALRSPSRVSRAIPAPLARPGNFSAARASGGTPSVSRASVAPVADARDVARSGGTTLDGAASQPHLAGSRVVPTGPGDMVPGGLHSMVLPVWRETLGLLPAHLRQVVGSLVRSGTPLGARPTIQPGDRSPTGPRAAGAILGGVDGRGAGKGDRSGAGRASHAGETHHVGALPSKRRNGSFGTVRGAGAADARALARAWLCRVHGPCRTSVSDPLRAPALPHPFSPSNSQADTVPVSSGSAHQGRAFDGATLVGSEQLAQPGLGIGAVLGAVPPAVHTVANEPALSPD